MSNYVPQEWIDNSHNTPIDAERLNHIEQGLTTHLHTQNAGYSIYRKYENSSTLVDGNVDWRVGTSLQAWGNPGTAFSLDGSGNLQILQSGIYNVWFDVSSNSEAFMAVDVEEGAAALSVYYDESLNVDHMAGGGLFRVDVNATGPLSISTWQAIQPSPTTRSVHLVALQVVALP